MKRIGRFYFGWASKEPEPAFSARAALLGDPREVTARIKAARLGIGLTQAQMAEALGMKLRGFQRYEAQTGNLTVPWRKLDRIAELTGRSTHWLLTGEESPNGS